jgi:hypothetical protein
MGRSPSIAITLLLLSGVVSPACQCERASSNLASDAGPDSIEAGMLDAGDESIADAAFDAGASPDANPDAAPRDALDWPADACVAACTASWTLVSNDRPAYWPNPLPLDGWPFVAVYDPIDQQMLVSNAPSAYVWALPFTGDHANEWRMLEPTGLAPDGLSTSAAMDPVRHRVLFLTNSYTGPTSTIGRLYALELSGTPTWTLLADHLPLGQLTRIFYDAPRDRIVMQCPYFTVTASASDPAMWRHVATHGAPPFDGFPNGHTTVLDEPRQRIVELTVEGNAAALSLTGTRAWSALPAFPVAAPEPRPGIYDPQNDRLVVFGGEGVWSLALSGTTGWSRWNPTPALLGRYSHAAIYDSGRKRMVIAGGNDFTPGAPLVVEPKTDVWALSLEGPASWTRLVDDSPRPSRFFGSVAFDEVSSQLIVLPADMDVRHVPAAHQFLTYRFSIPDRSWQKLEFDPRPAARVAPLFVRDPEMRRMILEGGFAPPPAPNHTDLWALDLSANPPWTELASNDMLLASTNAAFVPNLGVVVLSQLMDGTVPLSVSVLAGTSWVTLPTVGEAPFRGSMASLVYDEDDQSLIVFGGGAGGDNFAGLHELDLRQQPPRWSRIEVQGDRPGPSRGHPAVYDRDHRAMIIFRWFDALYDQTCGFDAEKIWLLNLEGERRWTRVRTEGVQPEFSPTVVWTPFGVIAYGGAIWRFAIERCR